MVISYINKVLSEDSARYIAQSKEKNLYFKKTSQAEIRSNQRMKKYWSYDIKIIASNIDYYTKYIIQDEKGKQSFELVHRLLSLNFAKDCNRLDLIKEEYEVAGNQIIKVQRVHVNFKDMKEKDMGEYIDYYRRMFFNRVGKTIDEVGYEQGI